MKKKLTNKEINQVLTFFNDNYFTDFTKYNDTTLIKRNGPFLLCLTLDEKRDRTSFQIVRHIHFLVSDADSIKLSVAYRATNHNGRIPRVINFTNLNLIENVKQKFEQDISRFSILQNDDLSLSDIIKDFDDYFSNTDRCDAQYQAKLYFNWLLTLSILMDGLDFEVELNKIMTKLHSWPNSAFRKWGSFENYKIEINKFLNDRTKIDSRIQNSLVNLSINELSKLSGTGTH